MESGVDTERKVAALNRVVRIGFIEKVTLNQDMV